MMKVEKIIKLLNENNKVEFKLYSLNYVIENKDNITIIYSTAYPKDIKKYNNIEELLNSFTIYNELLIEHDNRIIIVGGKYNE